MTLPVSTLLTNTSPFPGPDARPFAFIPVDRPHICHSLVWWYQYFPLPCPPLPSPARALRLPGSYGTPGRPRGERAGEDTRGEPLLGGHRAHSHPPTTAGTHHPGGRYLAQPSAGWGRGARAEQRPELVSKAQYTQRQAPVRKSPTALSPPPAPPPPAASGPDRLGPQGHLVGAGASQPVNAPKSPEPRRTASQKKQERTRRGTGRYTHLPMSS